MNETKDETKNIEKEMRNLLLGPHKRVIITWLCVVRFTPQICKFVDKNIAKMIALMIPVDFRFPISGIQLEEDCLGFSWEDRFHRTHRGVGASRSYGICHVCFFPSAEFAATIDGERYSKSLCQLHYQDGVYKSCNCESRGFSMTLECVRNFKHLFLIPPFQNDEASIEKKRRA